MKKHEEASVGFLIQVHHNILANETNVSDSLIIAINLKSISFRISNRICIASTYFDYPNEKKYTWYSCDKKTMNVNDYVLTEKYVKQCVRECVVKPDIDLDSDHLILITSSYILMTRKARRRSKGKVKVNLLNLDHYKIQKPRQLL